MPTPLMTQYPKSKSPTQKGPIESSAALLAKQAGARMREVTARAPRNLTPASKRLRRAKSARALRGAWFKHPRARAPMSV